MAIATVDIGNSTLKISFPELDGFGIRMVETVSDAVAIAEKEGAEAVAFSTTRNLTPEEKELVRRAAWWELSAGCNLPIELNYATPSTLGVDRLAAAVGATALYPEKALVVADAGTALTVDVVSAAGTFEGGNISPGINMRLRALHNYTSRLPLVEVDNSFPHFGQDTRTAIGAGCFWGVINEIYGSFLAARNRFGCGLLVLTGGDAPKIREGLAAMAGNGMEVIHEPMLVHHGLIKAYLFNHDI